MAIDSLQVVGWLWSVYRLPTASLRLSRGYAGAIGGVPECLA